MFIYCEPEHLLYLNLAIRFCISKCKYGWNCILTNIPTESWAHTGKPTVKASIWVHLNIIMLYWERDNNRTGSLSNQPVREEERTDRSRKRIINVYQYHIVDILIKSDFWFQVLKCVRETLKPEPTAILSSLDAGKWLRKVDLENWQRGQRRSSSGECLKETRSLKKRWNVRSV